MTEHAIINGEYVTFKHVKTRKVVVLEIEVAEELFQDVISKLGMPIGGESKPVAVCLLDCYKENSIATTKIAPEKSEGEKLMQRACILCGEGSFQNFLVMSGYANQRTTLEATNSLYNICKIKSRAEIVTNLEARELFRELVAEYTEWRKPSVENQYEDNLSRG